MSKLSILVLSCVALMAFLQSVQAYGCTKDEDCDIFQLSLRCNDGQCDCKAGYKLDLTIHPGGFNARCSMKGGLIAAIVIIVLGVIAAGVAVFFMKKRRMACFA